jgi:ABC-type multidrug transport system fused ATPase/permease subunit
MATENIDSNGLSQDSSGEETSTLNASMPGRLRDYAYFSPIGEPVNGKDIDEDDKYSEKEERHAFTRRPTYIAEDDQRELQRIATAISRNRPSTTRAEESFRTLSSVANIPLDDPELDPNGPSFSLTKWIRVFMSQLRDEGHNTQSTGVVFKNVNVSGSGSALQLQPTVSSMLLTPLRLGELFSFGKKEHKQILQNFSGHMNAGEMLIVLGRPGSGCSTLLKTLTGQLHGLELQKDSLIHFDGIPQSKIIKEFKGETTYNQEVRHI